MSVQHSAATQDVALVDLVDRLIDGGVVVTGDILLSVADVDLIYLGLRLVIAPAREAGPAITGRRAREPEL